MEKLCTVARLSEIDHVYVCEHDMVFLRVAHRDTENNLIVSSVLEIWILDCQT